TPKTASFSGAPQAASPAASQIGLDSIKNSVLRIGMEVGGTLDYPQAVWDADNEEFVPGSKIMHEPVTAYWLGTGFVVDENGYLITNAHVVDTSTQSLTDALWNEYQYDTAAYFQDEYPDFTQAQVDAITGSFLSYASKNAQWSGVTYNPVVFNPDKPDAIGDFRKLFDAG